jgi:hypothetical protein
VAFNSPTYVIAIDDGIDAVVGVYQRHEYAEEKRAALDAWARRLEAIIGGETEAKVLPFVRQ